VWSWLVTITKNLTIDHYRKKDFKLNVNYRDEIDPEVMEVTDACPLSISISTERRLLVDQALVGLPSDLKTIINEGFRNDLSHSEISKKLNIPLGTVKTRFRMAYKKLLCFQKLSEV